jgi:hypothetical protein
MKKDTPDDEKTTQEEYPYMPSKKFDESFFNL